MFSSVFGCARRQNKYLMVPYYSLLKRLRFPSYIFEERVLFTLE